ncbi:nucleoredoxin-like X1 [Biomphalaria glabrata]
MGRVHLLCHMPQTIFSVCLKKEGTKGSPNAIALINHLRCQFTLMAYKRLFERPRNIDLHLHLRTKWQVLPILKVYRQI